MKITFIFIHIFLFFNLSFGSQALRDKPDSTDHLKISPLKGLHYIDVTTEEDIFAQKGINKKPGSYQFYFRLDGEAEYTKVSYFGINLSQYVMPVPESYRLIKSYQYLKMTRSFMFFGGILLSVIGGSISLYKNELSPMLLVGVAVFTGSWIPGYISHSKIPESVGVYNTKIGEYKQKNP